jgi:hypothetical protein
MPIQASIDVRTDVLLTALAIISLFPLVFPDAYSHGVSSACPCKAVGTPIDNGLLIVLSFGALGFGIFVLWKNKARRKPF